MGVEVVHYVEAFRPSTLILPSPAKEKAQEATLWNFIANEEECTPDLRSHFFLEHAPMIERWFDHINHFLHTHPDWMAHLAFLFRLKCGLLTLLALYFVYLVYREQPKPAPSEAKAYTFVA